MGCRPRSIFYISRLALLGETHKVPEGCVGVVETGIKRRRLRGIKVTPGFILYLPNPTHLGTGEEFLLNAAKIIRAGGLIRIFSPRVEITEKNSAGRLILGLIESSRKLTKQKKLLSDLLASLFFRNSAMGRPRKFTQETIESVIALHKQNISIRGISAELEGVSRSTVMRILRNAHTLEGRK